jgi:hypothetical protein
MKAQKKNSHGLYLKKSNNRWKWMAGATAATAAGVTASQGSTITINLVGNFIGGEFASGGGNHLNADLTGDGHPDLTIANASYMFYTARAILNGVGASVRYYYGFSHSHGVRNSGSMRLGSQRASWYLYDFHVHGTQSLTGSIPIFFKDLHINGGAPTMGSLEVTVGPYVIQLDSLTYTSNTAVQGSTRAVPDQGSSLALLAMGASGILALRRWRTAQKRS